jgi:uncharacterized protein
MAQIKRYLQEQILQDLNYKKICIIYGPRQVGKTTLVKTIAKLFPRHIYLNGDLIEDQKKLNEHSRAMVSQFAGNDLLVIDEAQRVEDIGIKLKVIFDTLPNLKILTTGSSSFELSNIINEPLTGRHFAHIMYPVSVAESIRDNVFSLPDFLVYGSYPEVATAVDGRLKRKFIEDIAGNYLFKDVLNIEYIKNPRSLGYLLEVVALQVGNEVSANELANTLDLDAKTVLRYLDILEKLYIIFPLRPYFNNRRKSITKMKKYYFYDLGIRNAILNDFSPIDRRSDAGALWENFCVVERYKRNDQMARPVQYYFWRSYQGDEIDLIEMDNRRLTGYECKWQARDLPSRLKKIYTKDLDGQGDLQVISQSNFLPFVTGD